MLKWNKRGLIFKPTDHVLPLGCKEFAQAPQALVMADRVRVYFSTRYLESDSGKYLSHIAYVDFSKDMSSILGVSQRAVIDLGNVGTFDEHGVFPMHVRRVGDMVYGYVCGANRRKSVPVDSAIGLAVSHDSGETFQRIGPGPVLAASLHEPCLVADGFVLKINEQYRMWYIFGSGWQQSAAGVQPERVYKIATAISADGVSWTERTGKSIIAPVLGDDECQAMPTVIQFNGKWHMFFCFRHANGFRDDVSRSYRIGYAYSDDAVNWTREDSSGGLTRSESGWDSQMMCYPHVFECNGRVFILYNGNAFGRGGFGLAELETYDGKPYKTTIMDI